MLTIALAVFAFFIGLLYSVLSLVPRTHQRLPPGPTPLPVIGNLHMLGSLPHRALQALARKHGSVMKIHLGRVHTVVISSPEAAEQVLRAQDRAFASRPRTEGSKYLIYGARGVAFTTYGPEWRNLRKLCTMQLIVLARTRSFAALQRLEVAHAVEMLRKPAERREAVDLSERVSDVVEELTFRMMVGSLEVDSVHFKGPVKEGTRLIGAFNLADYVPSLGVLDLQGLTRKMKKLSIAIDETLDQILAECWHKSRGGNESSSFAEGILSMLNDPDEDHSIQLVNVKAIIVEMVAAAFDTTVTAVEWTLSELLRHPAALARVHQELDDVVGLDRAVDEADLPRLAYLEMAIMESFRLHPVAPFLIPVGSN